MKIITLTTDFGCRDWFVGAMKGVILEIQPGTTIVDLTHELEPGDLRGAAFALLASYRFFPKGTVHVVVVDPGVGGPRPALAVETSNYLFAAPDNGVLTFALANERIKAVHRLEIAKFFRQPVSRTFHGRDVFAPVAAHLAGGVPLRRFGSKQESCIRLDWPSVKVLEDRVEGEIVHVDRFGNLITNLDAASLRGFGDRPCEVFRGRNRLCPIAPFYGAVSVGRPLAVMGSTGFLEVAVNGASAARRFGLRVGDRLSVRPWVKSR